MRLPNLRRTSGEIRLNDPPDAYAGRLHNARYVKAFHNAKTWLFLGHPQARDRPAILYSILISCQRLGINVAEYLTEVLSIDTRVADDDQLAALTPARWIKARPN